MENIRRFDAALYGVGFGLQSVLRALPDNVKASADEIRLRLNKPLALTVGGRTVLVGSNGQTLTFLCDSCVMVSRSDLDEAYRLLCNNSVYAHTDELKNGYIMMKQGCRAGVCGRLNKDGFMCDITSVNIRIAREIFSAADPILQSFNNEGWLIAGPPASGKTTVLRDMIRRLSNGLMGEFYRIAVIDSRGELWGGGANDLGICTDVLITEDKALGMEIALRTMFPEIIAFDEIGTESELKRVSESFNAGVKVLTTAHIGNISELKKRKVTQKLLNSGAVSKVAVLPKTRGEKFKILDAEELL